MFTYALFCFMLGNQNHSDFIRNDEITWLQALVVNNQGDLFMLDSGANKIWCYDAEGQLKFTFGEKGSGPGAFQVSTDLVLLPNGRILVLDDGTKKLNYFDAKGKYLESFPVQLPALGRLFVRSDNDMIVTATNGTNFSYQFGAKTKKEKRYRFAVISPTGELKHQFGAFIDHENPLLESQFNHGSMALLGDSLYFAGRLQNEWTIYQNELAKTMKYKLAFAPREPRAEMIKTKTPDGRFNFNMKMETDILSLSMVAVNDKSLLMLRPISGETEMGIPSQLVLFDLKGRVLKVFPKTIYSNTLAVSPSGTYAYYPIQTEEGSWLIKRVSL